MNDKDIGSLFNGTPKTYDSDLFKDIPAPVIFSWDCGTVCVTKKYLGITYLWGIIDTNEEKTR